MPELAARKNLPVIVRLAVIYFTVAYFKILFVTGVSCAMLLRIGAGHSGANAMLNSGDYSVWLMIVIYAIALRLCRIAWKKADGFAAWLTRDIPPDSSQSDYFVLGCRGLGLGFLADTTPGLLTALFSMFGNIGTASHIDWLPIVDNTMPNILAWAAGLFLLYGSGKLRRVVF